MLKSFKSFKSFKGNSNLLFQILCKSTAILLYRCEENIKNLLNRIFVRCLLCYCLYDCIPLLYLCYTFAFSAAHVALMLR